MYICDMRKRLRTILPRLRGVVKTEVTPLEKMVKKRDIVFQKKIFGFIITIERE